MEPHLEAFFLLRTFNSPQEQIRLSKYPPTLKQSSVNKILNPIGSCWLEVDFVSKTVFVSLIQDTLYESVNCKVKSGLRHAYNFTLLNNSFNFSHCCSQSIIIKKITLPNATARDREVELACIQKEQEIMGRYKAALPDQVAMPHQYFKPVVRPNKVFVECWQPAYAATMDSPLSLSVAQKVSLLTNVGQVLDAMHNNKQCHRDAKLSNILIQQNHDGTVSAKLNDFQLAGPHTLRLDNTKYAYWAPTLVANSMDDMWALTLDLGIIIFGERFKNEISSLYFRYETLNNLLYELFIGTRFGNTFMSYPEIQACFDKAYEEINTLTPYPRVVCFYYRWINKLICECRLMDAVLNREVAPGVTAQELIKNKQEGHPEILDELENSHSKMSDFFNLIQTISPDVIHFGEPEDMESLVKELEEIINEVMKSDKRIKFEYGVQKTGALCNYRNGGTQLRNKKVNYAYCQVAENLLNTYISQIEEIKRDKKRDLEIFRSKISFRTSSVRAKATMLEHPKKNYAYFGSSWMLKNEEHKELNVLKFEQTYFENDQKKVKVIASYVFSIEEDTYSKEQSLSLPSISKHLITRFKIVTNSLAQVTKLYNSLKSLQQSDKVVRLFPLSLRYKETTKTNPNDINTPVLTHALIEMIENEELLTQNLSLENYVTLANA